MFHTTSFPGSFHPREMEPGVLVVEDRIAADGARRRSRRRGHEVVPQGPWSLGRMCAVSRDPPTGVLARRARTPAACRGTPSAASWLRQALSSGLGRHHHRVERERLGPVALHLQRAGEHAAHGVQLTGRQPQEVGALDGDGRVAPLALGRAGLDRADAVRDVHDVAVDLPVLATRRSGSRRESFRSPALPASMKSGNRRNTSSSTIGRKPPSITERMCLRRRRRHRSRHVDRVERASGRPRRGRCPGTVKTLPTASASISSPSMPS